MNWYRQVKIANAFMDFISDHTDELKLWWEETGGTTDDSTKLPDGFYFEEDDGGWKVVGPDHFVVTAKEPTLRDAKLLAMSRLKLFVDFAMNPVF